MNTVQLTVFFENPFWVAIIEKRTELGLEVARHVFGAEPSDPEIYAWLLRAFDSLCFGKPVSGIMRVQKSTNPKRRRREARRAMNAPAMGTQAQQALKLALEQNKLVRKSLSKSERDAEAMRKFQLKQEKRKAKHRGR